MYAVSLELSYLYRVIVLLFLDSNLDLITRYHDRLYQKVSRGYEKVSRGYEKVSRGYEKVSRGYEKVCKNPM